MQEKYSIVLKSTNSKTGNIPVVTSPSITCPKSCIFRNNGCYAAAGPIKIHWRKIDNNERGVNFDKLLSIIKDIPDNTKVRLFQAGDLPGIGDRINIKKTKKLVNACKNLLAWGYTHKPLDSNNNAMIIKYCNDNGLTINLSANNLDHADELLSYNIAPVVVVLPKKIKNNILTPTKKRVKICPAILNDDFNCKKCGGNKGPLCYNVNRNFIIGFPAHGFAKNKVSEMVEKYAKSY